MTRFFLVRDSYFAGQGVVGDVLRRADGDRQCGPDGARVGAAGRRLSARAAGTQPRRVVPAVLHRHSARQRRLRLHHQGETPPARPLGSFLNYIINNINKHLFRTQSTHQHNM